MAVKEGKTRQTATPDAGPCAKVLRVAGETGLSTSKVLAAGAARLAGPDGDSPGNADARVISEAVSKGAAR